MAAHHGHSDVVRQLLQNEKVVVNARSRGYDASALHMAAYHGHCETMQLLLNSEKVEAVSADRWGQNALHVAAGRGCVSAVEELLNCAKFEDGVNAKDSQEFTALHLAASKGHVVVIDCLLKRIDNQTLHAKTRLGKIAEDVTRSDEVKRLLRQAKQSS
eukprot:3251434-Amphidinium_carterae.1